MSIDPDDVTRKGIRQAGARIIFYGTPVLPGAMFLYARLGEVPLLGLPACVFYHQVTLFDLMLPLSWPANSPPGKKSPPWVTAASAGTVRNAATRFALSVKEVISMALPGLTILIRGAGEMASGVAWRLFQSHFGRC